MCLFHSHEELRRADLKTVGWFFATMAIVTLGFTAILAIHYLLGWW